MLDSLKQTGRHIGHEIYSALENLAEGWRELFARSNNALAHFISGIDETGSHEFIAKFTRWRLLAGEVEETNRDVMVSLELRGKEKEDFHISIEGRMLYLNGEKHFKRQTHDSIYHVTERANGSFQRTIQLPQNVNKDQAEARYHNGVLSIRIPISRTGDDSGHVIKVD